MQIIKNLFNKQKPIDETTRLEEEAALQEQLQKELLIPQYNALTKNRFITIKNVKISKLKNEVLTNGSYGSSGSFLSHQSSGKLDSTTVGAGILSFIHTKNAINCQSLCEYQETARVEWGDGCYQSRGTYVPLPFELSGNINTYSIHDIVLALQKLKNDFSSVEIVAKQITDITFKQSQSENSYYDICYPETLYLNKEDWDKIIGI